jgi:hypothetical protein
MHVDWYDVFGRFTHLVVMPMLECKVVAWALFASRFCQMLSCILLYACGHSVILGAVCVVNEPAQK